MEKISRKTLLYKTGVEYGDYTINHIQGCSHGCKYPCYAMLMARRFGRVKSYEDWCKPKIVENALLLLDDEIPKLKDVIKSVHLCFTTDPFMTGYEEVSELSLKIINKLNRSGIKVTTLTKGLYPSAIWENGFSPLNEYGVTLVSVKEEHRNKYEPHTATYEERIEVLRRIHNAGLKTWVSIEPYPTPNIIQQDLLGLLKKISFVDRIIFGKLNYSKDVGQYPYKEGFYNKCSRDVISFCKTHEISLHIKNGTYVPKGNR
jgi:DNA repair photolyase